MWSASLVTGGDKFGAKVEQQQQQQLRHARYVYMKAVEFTRRVAKVNVVLCVCVWHQKRSVQSAECTNHFALFLPKLNVALARINTHTLDEMVH